MRAMEHLLRRLHQNQVEFVIVGGFAAVAHGVTYLTRDLDLCVPFTLDNAHRLLSALTDINPRHRLTPTRLILDLTPERLIQYRNLYLETDLGAVDLLSEISGIGDYQAVVALSIEMNLWSIPCIVLGLDGLIAAKQVLSQPKDKEVLRQLLAIKEQREF